MKRSLWTLVLPCVLVTLSATPQRVDAEAHKVWMDDAADAQDELREALAGEAFDKAVPPAEKIAELMALTEQYWSKKKAADIVKLAQQTQVLARQVATTAKNRNLAGANAAFAQMNATCNACHDLHPEKRP